LMISGSTLCGHSPINSLCPGNASKKEGKIVLTNASILEYFLMN
jgi:hypothetical protein